MKRTIFGTLVAVSFAIVWMVAGCNLFLIDQKDGHAVQNYGGVTLTVGGNASPRTLMPAFTIASYSITATGPGGETKTLSPVGGEPRTLDRLAVGNWTFEVLGKNASGETVASGSKTVKIEEGIISEVTVDVYFHQNAAGNISITVQWPATVPVDDVKVMLDWVPQTGLAFGGSATFTYSRTGVASKDYVVVIELSYGTLPRATVVRAVHVYDNLNSTETIVLTEADFTGPPAAPTGIAAAKAPGKIVVTWTDASYVETSYRIERSLSSGSGFTSLAENLPANTIAYEDATAAVNGTTYYYRVMAENAVGPSAFSDVALQSIGLAAAPSVSGQTFTMSDTPKFVWQAVPGAAVYRFRLASEVDTWTETGDLFCRPAGMPNGLSTLYVQAGDGAGNWSPSGSYQTERKFANLHPLSDGIMMPQYFYATAIYGSYLYAAGGQRGLEIFNLTNPENPVFIRNIKIPGVTSVENLLVKDHYLFIGSQNGLTSYDITVPLSPVYLANKSIPCVMYPEMETYGNHLFLAVNAGGLGLAVFDVSNPAVLTEVNRIPVGAVAAVNSRIGVHVKDHYLYLTDPRATRLDIIDLTQNMATAAVTKTVALPVYPESINQWNNSDVIVDSRGYAFILRSNGSNNLSLVNVNDPGNPLYVGEFGSGYAGWGFSLGLIGNYLYVCNSGLPVFDISNPVVSIPFVKGVGVDAINMLVNGSIAYVGMREKGLTILDATDPASGTIKTKMSVCNAYQMAVSGNHAYIAGGKAGTFVVDVANSGAPKLIKNIPSPDGSDVEQVLIYGTTLYTASTWNIIQVVDISDPENASVIRTISPGGTDYVCLDGKYLYTGSMSTGSEYIGICDLTDPRSPVKLPGSILVTEDILGMEAHGGYLYLALGDRNSVETVRAHLKIYDVTNPSSPSLVKTCALTYPLVGHVFVWGIKFHNNRLLINVANYGVEFMDVSNPADPKPVTVTNTVKLFNGMSLQGDYLMDANNTTIRFVNIFDPLALTVEKEVTAPEPMDTATIHGDYIYVFDKGYGFRVFGGD